MLQVTAEQVQVLNSVRAKLPFLVTCADDAKDFIKEEIRLRYRSLDLRRPQMSSNIMLRHQVVKVIRRYLEDIETPILSRSTPEGARDYLVPSRVQPGTFYALPQSPQLFKQMLMVSGFDKYHQIARCFRDEDIRVCLDIKGVELQNPFPRLTYAETTSLYGSDRPDTRFDLQLKDKMMTTKVLAEVEKIKSRNENELNHSHENFMRLVVLIVKMKISVGA
ncbi:hypothetical protein LXL04_007335 [Taraxacum kok-saghyz]